MIEDAHYPNFLISCDNDHDEVILARYTWKGFWEQSDRSMVKTYFMEGNERDWWQHYDPVAAADAAPDVRPNERPYHSSSGPSRVRHEIRCVAPGCRAKCRIENDELQTLFAVIAANKWFQTEFASKVTPRKITVTLSGLWHAQTEWNRLKGPDNEAARHQT
jgi:hypothetical protein